MTRKEAYTSVIVMIDKCNKLQGAAFGRDSLNLYLWEHEILIKARQALIELSNEMERVKKWD